MAENPLRNVNKGLQTKSEVGDVKQSITLYDIDYAIMTYLEDVVLPTLDENGKAVKIPVIYGNSERWEGARKKGVYRDQKGRIQLPLMMLKRSSVAKNDAMPMLNRHVSYQSIQKYSKENRYDRFSLLSNQKPKYQVYNITMPDYVEIKYECMGWTSYTEHLNAIVESLTWASDEYWGDKTKFKFQTTITDYNIINEVSEGTERINRVEFNLNVKAYLLPERFDGEVTTKKLPSVSRVVVSSETDMTSNGRLEDALTNPSQYYENKDAVDYISLTTTNQQNPIANNTISFTGVKLIKPPGVLAGIVSGSLSIDYDNYELKVYIDGVRYYQTTHFTATYSSTSYTLILNFIEGAIGFTVTSANEVSIIGKFINL